jgi:hypothetical protein
MLRLLCEKDTFYGGLCQPAILPPKFFGCEINDRPVAEAIIEKNNMRMIPAAEAYLVSHKQG